MCVCLHKKCTSALHPANSLIIRVEVDSIRFNGICLQHYVHILYSICECVCVCVMVKVMVDGGK